MFRLLALDIDGTVLTSDHRITPATAAAVGNAVRRGCTVVLLSARMPAAIQPIADGLGLAGAPVAAYNGALLTRLPFTGAPLHEAPLAGPDAGAVVALAHAAGVWPSLYRRDSWLVQDISAAVREEERITGVASSLVPDLAAAAAADGAHKILVMGPNRAFPALARRIRAATGGRAAIAVSKPGYMEVTGRRASKAHALAWWCRELGIRLAETVAAGDGHNDLPMLRLAGCAVAMGTAPEPVRAAADLVTAGSDADGLALALRQINWGGGAT